MTEQYVDFVHLHNHSDYSLYDGFMTIENMVKRAKELKFKAIALTDHGRVGGFIKLHNMAKKYGVKGIYGLEAYIVHDLSDPKGKRYHQTILAKSEIGYKNILKLSTIGNQNAKRGFPRLTFELLKQHHEGLIIASGCSAGEFAALAIDRRDNDAFALAERYKEVWGSDYYLEVMYTKYEPQLTVLKKAIECAKYTGIKIIATNDCHYSLESDAKYHDLKISISRSAPLKEEDKTPPEYFLKSYDEMKRIFTKTEMLHNTMEIEEKCDFDITLGTGKLPEFKVPTDNNDFNEFKKNLVGRNDEEAFLSYLAEKGLKENGLHENTVYVERLRTELETIRFTGFARYFLIVWDYIDYARNVNKQRIGAGRGSGAGSLVLFCLGITAIDPVKYNLSMDRFLFADAEYNVNESDFFGQGE